MHCFRADRNFFARLILAGSVFLSSALAAPKKVDLSRLVVVGDSLSAGFQNFSLFDSNSVSGLPPGGQTYGFATQIANQANTALPLPLISYPGIPPALTLTPGGIVRESGFGQRENPAEQTTNLSVPGFAVADALSHPFPGNLQNAIDALAASILGTPAGVLPGCGPIPSPNGTFIVSEVACAQALKPSTIFVSLGNNDALQVLTFGVPPTDPVVFLASYAAVLKTLAGTTRATIVVANIPDVTAVPFLVPAPQFYAQCGFLPPGATSQDFVVPNILNPTTNDFNICINYSVRSAALIQQGRDAVKAYNVGIAALAKTSGATVVDINGMFADIAANGYPLGNATLTTAFLGGLFSLDGIHPTNTGYTVLANEWINTINKKLNGNIPLVDVGQVALTDPLVLSKP